MSDTEKALAVAIERLLMVILKPIRSKCGLKLHSQWGQVFGTMASLTGLIFINADRLTTLTCQRTESQPAVESAVEAGCTITTLRPLISSNQNIKLAELQSARLERRYLNHYHVSYQVVLQTKTHTIPITEASPTQRPWKLEITEEINHFLRSPNQATLQLQLKKQHEYWHFGLFLVASGTLTGLFAHRLSSAVDSSK